MKSMIEDFRLQAVGGTAGAIDVWEMVICSKLLANCGSWLGIGKPAFKLLNQLKDSYLRMDYSCPPTTPIPALHALAGVWEMKHKVALEKVCLVSDTLHRRQEQNYARELLAEELAQGWPGITREVKAICRQMGLPDATEKYLYRKEVKEATPYHHLNIIKDEMEGK